MKYLTLFLLLTLAACTNPNPQVSQWLVTMGDQIDYRGIRAEAKYNKVED